MSDAAAVPGEPAPRWKHAAEQPGLAGAGGEAARRRRRGVEAAAPAAGDEGRPASAPAAGSATPTVRPALRPLREYPVPVARPGGAWPFCASVYRWQPVVEAELDLLRRQRQVDPLLSVELVLAVIAAESGGNPEAVSRPTPAA